MSDEDQERYLAGLVLEERRSQKHIACLLSKIRRISDALSPLAIKSSFHEVPSLSEVSNARADLSRISDANAGQTLEDLENELRKLEGLRSDIHSIESAGRPRQ